MVRASMLLSAGFIWTAAFSSVQGDAKEAAIKLGSEYVQAARRVQVKERAHVDVEAARPQLDARRGRIAEEVARGAPAWAGTYYQGDGLGVNVTLTIAPKGGATYTWSGCVGLYDLNHGSVTGVSEDGIDLDLAFSPDQNKVWNQADCPHPYMSSRWVPVTWGKERFLIPDCQMIAFCNAVNDGSTFLPFPHRIEKGNWHREVERSADPPGVPTAYRPFLLATPIDATILQASEPTGKLIDETTIQYRVMATVGIGSDSGLLPGMVLHAQGLDSGPGEVVEVEPARARVEFFFVVWKPDHGVPRQGWALSTLEKK